MTGFYLMGTLVVERLKLWVEGIYLNVNEINAL